MFDLPAATASTRNAFPELRVGLAADLGVSFAGVVVASVALAYCKRKRARRVSGAREGSGPTSRQSRDVNIQSHERLDVARHVRVREKDLPL